jgi:uncharacterized protein YwbE
MEKDHFKDRPIESTLLEKVQPGTKVMICQKAMQKYAEEIGDLDTIIVSRNLTSQKQHPRGQKVEGYDVITGMYKKGRVVYIMDDNLILTKNGWIERR